MKSKHVAMFLVAVTASVCVAPQRGVAAEVVGYLKPSEIQEVAPCKFVGRYYRSDDSIPSGEAIAGQMTSGGIFFMTWHGGSWPTGRYDKARWWIEGTSWCRQFAVFSGGRSACYGVRRN